MGYDKLDSTGYQAGDSALAPAYTGITTDKELLLYFRRDPVITVDYKYLLDPTGPSIAPLTLYNMDRGADYNMSEMCYESIDEGTFMYNYYGYTIGSDTTVIPGKPPAPQFTSVQEDQHITLYFSKDPAVIVYFVEYKNESHILKSTYRELVTYEGNWDSFEALKDDIILSGRTLYF